jgi:hypothetical protein
MRPYRRTILVSGILLFVVGTYIDRRNVMAAFMRGFNAGFNDSRRKP